ncbi:AraC family transcriptional regulator [Gemmatimonas sp.]
MSSSAAHVVLPFGQFYGREEVRRSAPDLEWALLRADPHRIVSRHSHDEAHFVLVLDGLYVSSAVGAPAVSHGVQLIYNPPGTTHRDRFEARDRVVSGRFLALSVGTEALAALRMHTTRDDTPQHAVVIESAGAIAAAHRLAVACTRQGRDAAYEQQAMALELLCHADNTVRVTHSAPCSHAAAPAWLQRACEYLDDSRGGQSCIAEAARVAGVHPVHLARVFRRFTGQSPATYVRQRRLEQAQCLLRFTTRSAAEIADSCGFADQSHFTHAFRNVYGATPAAYRAAHGVAELSHLPN